MRSVGLTGIFEGQSATPRVDFFSTSAMRGGFAERTRNRRPFTAETGVRFPQGAPEISSKIRDILVLELGHNGQRQEWERLLEHGRINAAAAAVGAVFREGWPGSNGGLGARVMAGGGHTGMARFMQTSSEFETSHRRPVPMVVVSASSQGNEAGVSTATASGANLPVIHQKMLGSMRGDRGCTLQYA